MKHRDMILVVYNEPQAFVVLDQGIYAHTAFRTRRGLAEFLARFGGKLIFRSEHRDCRVYQILGEFSEQYFWDIAEIPVGATKFIGLCNGGLVECYSHNNVVYLPNPNAKDVYKPLPLKEHIAHRTVHG